MCKIHSVQICQKASFSSLFSYLNCKAHANTKAQIIANGFNIAYFSISLAYQIRGSYHILTLSC